MRLKYGLLLRSHTLSRDAACAIINKLITTIYDQVPSFCYIKHSRPWTQGKWKDSWIKDGMHYVRLHNIVLIDIYWKTIYTAVITRQLGYPKICKGIIDCFIIRVLKRCEYYPLSITEHVRKSEVNYTSTNQMLTVWTKFSHIKIASEVYSLLKT